MKSRFEVLKFEFRICRTGEWNVRKFSNWEFGSIASNNFLNMEPSFDLIENSSSHQHYLRTNIWGLESRLDFWPRNLLITDVQTRDDRPAPRKNRLSRPAPQKVGLALPCPSPKNWRNPQGAAGQNWLQFPLLPLSIMPANDALKEERVGKYFHFSLLAPKELL